MRILMICVIAMLAGCALGPQKKGPEPPTIIIRNSCHNHLSQVVLKEPRAEGRPVSMGAVSPILKNSQFVYPRPTDPPPLLRLMKAVWTEDRGQTYMDYVSLDAILKEATGEPDEALVFDFFPRGEIKVYLERMP